MIILRQGDSAVTKAAPWWVGTKVICPYCTFEAVMEESDKPIWNGYTLSLTCPTCTNNLCQLRPIDYPSSKSKWNIYPDSKPGKTGVYIVHLKVEHEFKIDMIPFDASCGKDAWEFSQFRVTHWLPLPNPPN